jgi:hypothetical protein
MNARSFSSTRSTAILFLGLAAAISALPGACGTTTTHGDAGGAGGLPGSSGVGGGTGSGGRSASDAGPDARASGTGGRGVDAGADARGSGGAGGTIVTVDAAGNTFTCADLLTCCNRVTNTTLMAACLQQYNTLRTQGDAACGNFLAQVRANGGCP